MNIAIMCISMAAVTRSPPDYIAAQKSFGVNPGPVVTQSFTSLPIFDEVMFFYGVDMNIFITGSGHWSHEHG